MNEPAKILFVTGTDTGVGKTLCTALLLCQLRARGCRALAMKPFCSGSRHDVNLLQSLQPGELTEAEMNPFYFPEPVAPLASPTARHRRITLAGTLAQIQSVRARCEVLLIEGAGGLLVPLGKRFTVLDLIGALDCRPIVVSRNRLGTINHTLLTVDALKSYGNPTKLVVLMDCARPDISSLTNAKLIGGLLKPIRVENIPYLGSRVMQARDILIAAKKIEKSLELVAKTAR